MICRTVAASVKFAGLFVLLASVAFGETLVLVGGVIIDGSGKPGIKRNMRIRDGEIAEIGPFRPAKGEATLDVTGLVVAPGFIDLHNHSTTVLDANLDAVSQITQGITTIVVGLDGEGPFEVEAFMSRFDEQPPALNIVTFAGHSTIRRKVMGNDFSRAATAKEVQEMEALVEKGMREGAFGLSMSFAPGPGGYAAMDERIALAKAVARYGGSLVCELGKGDNSDRTLAEALEVARQAKVPLELSQVSGNAARVLSDIDKARMMGVDVAADVSPYADARDFIRHAWVLVASDGRINDTLPRGAGTFPRVLNQLVATEKVLTLEAAVRKMSGLAAARLGLKQRGVLLKGAVADVVVFDPAQVKDRATVEEPALLSQGMKYVFVNGVLVVKNGQPTDARPGSGLR